MGVYQTSPKPEILAFLCNWCSYAGADLAGVSRISYPSNVRIIRLMCSGRVDPAFIIKAFQMGMDGVLVSGCHLGECHYISGNLNAEKRIENTRKLLSLLGLGAERLRLEWISASEGKKFSRVIQDFTEDLKRMGPNPLKTEANEKTDEIEDESISETVRKTNVRYCLECGKCSSSCPITRRNPAFSPRIMVKRALTVAEDKNLFDEGIWECLTCGLCRERCPSDVHFIDFIRACRAMASKAGVTQDNSHGGTLQDIQRITANVQTNPNRLSWLPRDAKVSESGEILYFVGCLPYFDVVFEEIKVDTLKIAQSVVKILNVAGIEPTLLKNERCCGHDLLWTGDLKHFEKLVRNNTTAIRETNAITVLTSCAEGYRTLKLDYPKILGKLDFEVLHTSELLDELIGKEKIKFSKRIDKKVVYHDPCRLGRHMGLYDHPRNIISSIPGIELLEMDRTKENALCCGVSAWTNCGKCAKQIQLEKLKEAKETGADWLITACPKCLIHLKCALNGNLPIEREDVFMEMYDLSVLVAMAMNLT